MKRQIVPIRYLQMKWLIDFQAFEDKYGSETRQINEPSVIICIRFIPQFYLMHHSFCPATY